MLKVSKHKKVGCLLGAAGGRADKWGLAWTASSRQE